MVNWQSGKTSKDISDLVEGRTNAPQEKDLQSGCETNAAPTGANAWDNGKGLVGFQSVLCLIASNTSASSTSFQRQLTHSPEETPPRSPRSLLCVG